MKDEQFMQEEMEFVSALLKFVEACKSWGTDPKERIDNIIEEQGIED